MTDMQRLSYQYVFGRNTHGKREDRVIYLWCVSEKILELKLQINKCCMVLFDYRYIYTYKGIIEDSPISFISSM